MGQVTGIQTETVCQMVLSTVTTQSQTLPMQQTLSQMLMAMDYPMLKNIKLHTPSVQQISLTQQMLIQMVISCLTVGRPATESIHVMVAMEMMIQTMMDLTRTVMVMYASLNSMVLRECMQFPQNCMMKLLKIKLLHGPRSHSRVPVQVERINSMS